MALENNSKNYIRISKVDLDYKNSLASVYLEIYASENIRNNEKIMLEQKNKLILRYNELSLKGESVYKSVDTVVDEVKNSPEIKELIKNSTSLESINSAITERVNKELGNAHISGRTYDESVELLSVKNELDKISSFNIMTNTTIVTIPIKDITSKKNADIRDNIYEYLSKDSRYNHIWNT